MSRLAQDKGPSMNAQDDPRIWRVMKGGYRDLAHLDSTAYFARRHNDHRYQKLLRRYRD